MRTGPALSALLLAAPGLHAAPQSNVLVSSNAGLREYTPAGALVQTTPVPYPGGPPPITENVRDAALGHDGDVHVFNGTFAPFMSTRDVATGSWSHGTHPNWKTANNVSFGGIAVIGDHVFVTSQITLNALVRFDLTDSSSMEFGANFGGYIDLTAGRDGRLYALAGTVEVFDPETLQKLDTIALAAGVRAIAVDGAGEIYGASWDGDVYHFAPDGSLVASIPSGASNLTDIDVDPTGRLVIGGRFGDVILTDTALSAPMAWKAGGAPVFVAFADPTFSLYPASEVARLGTPPNPPALLPGATSGPVIGAVWDPSVRPFVPNAAMDFLILSSVPDNLATPFGTLLCGIHNARLFTTAPGTPFRIEIAADPALVGRRMCAQGGSFTAGGRRALTNALDITIGNL